MNIWAKCTGVLATILIDDSESSLNFYVNSSKVFCEDFHDQTYFHFWSLKLNLGIKLSPNNYEYMGNDREELKLCTGLALLPISSL